MVQLPSDEKEVLFAVKSSLLYHKGEAWVKKGGSGFDNTIGSYDGGETADIVGLFLLHKMKHLGADHGLYKDDGLGRSPL